jgi:hypothetical protein
MVKGYKYNNIVLKCVGKILSLFCTLHIYSSYEHNREPYRVQCKGILYLNKLHQSH